MNRTLKASLTHIIVANLLFWSGDLKAVEPPTPIRAILITGGCCHDYAAQKDILKSGIESRAHIVVDQVHSDDKSTSPPLAI